MDRFAKQIFDLGVAMNQVLAQDGMSLAAEIIAKGERLEREKADQALLPEEAQTIKAAHFLRQIIGT